MKFIIFAALVAVAAAAPAPQTFVFGNIPFGGVQTYSAASGLPFGGVQTYSAASGLPFTASANVLPTMYTSGSQPIVTSNIISGQQQPILYSAPQGSVISSALPQTSFYTSNQASVFPAVQPTFYSAVQPIAQVAAVVPKTIAKTPGSSHITY